MKSKTSGLGFAPTRKGITASDTVTTRSELDSIRAINAKKKGSDAVEAESPKAEKPTVPPSSGSDSVPDAPVPEPAPTSTSTQDDGRLLLTHEQLKTMMDQAANTATQRILPKVEQLEKQVEDEKDRAELIRREAEIERDELLKKIELERKNRDSIAKVFEQFGYAPPSTEGDARSSVYIAPASTRGGQMDKRDAKREFERIINDNKLLQARQVVNAQTGFDYVQRDLRPAVRFIFQNRDAMREAMDDLARQCGLLKGRVSDYTGGKDYTTFADLPPALQTYLSTVVRVEHSAQFVLWQFVNRTIETGIPPGQSILVPRVRHLEVGNTSADWNLTPGTPTVATRQPLNGDSVPCVIQEWGMGKTDTIRPVGMTDFVMASTIMDLESILQERIGYNYHLWEDIRIFELLAATTVVAYNQSGSVVTASGSVTAGGGGQLTLNFLGSLRAYASSRRFYPMPDGCFIYVAPPDQIAQLENDLQMHHAYADMTGVEELQNMMASKSRNEYSGRIRGYRGKLRGIHVFEQNSFGVGAPGNRGVQTESLGGASVTTTTGFLMGADAVGWATSLPMEIREDANNNFGRLRSFIWKSHENGVALDVDPLSDPPVSDDQQLRVLEVRASSTPV